MSEYDVFDVMAEKCKTLDFLARCKKAESSVAQDSCGYYLDRNGRRISPYFSDPEELCFWLDAFVQGVYLGTSIQYTSKES